MRNRAVIEYGEHHRDSRAVVSAERGSFRVEPVPVDRKVKAVLREVMLDVRALCADHVHVALQNDRR